MLISLTHSAACHSALCVLSGTAAVALLDSGDPVPFPPVEGRLTDWLGLGVYSVLVVAVCLVAWRMARTSAPPTPAPKANEGPPQDAPAP